MITTALLTFALSLSGALRAPNQIRPSEFGLSPETMEELNAALLSCGFGSFGSFEIENVYTVWDDAFHQEDVLIDFKEENGYLLLAPNGHIRSFSLAGDLEWIKGTANPLWFQGGALAELVDGKLDYHKQEEYYDIVVGDNPNASQNPVSYGSLYSYLYNKYGTSFTLDYSQKLTGLPTTSAYSDGYTQMAESVFVKDTTTSEGNCGLVSISNGLAYYSRYRGKTGLPSYSSTTGVAPYDRIDLIQAAAAEGYSPKSTYVTLHSIYKTVRDFALGVGYVCGGLNDSQTGTAFTGCAQTYGYNSCAYTPLSPGNYSDVIGEIGNNRPLQIRVSYDMYYKTHGMMVTGYRQYTGTKQIGNNIYVDIDIMCLSVLDGRSSSERWYDMDRWSSYPISQYRATAVTFAKLIIN